MWFPSCCWPLRTVVSAARQPGRGRGQEPVPLAGGGGWLIQFLLGGMVQATGRPWGQAADGEELPGTQNQTNPRNQPKS